MPSRADDACFSESSTLGKDTGTTDNKTGKDLKAPTTDNKTGKDKMNNRQYQPIEVGQQTKPLPNRAEVSNDYKTVTVTTKTYELSYKKDPHGKPYVVTSREKTTTYDMDKKKIRGTYDIGSDYHFTTTDEANQHIQRGQQDMKSQTSRQRKRLENDLTRTDYSWEKQAITQAINRLRGET